jgi:hypothetical protein
MDLGRPALAVHTGLRGGTIYAVLLVTGAYGSQPRAGAIHGPLIGYTACMRIRYAAGTALLLVAATGCSASHHASSSPSPAPASAISTVAQPVTARQAAQRIGATGYTDCGPAPGGGIISSGVARYHGHMIGIDAFVTNAARDAWLQVAAGFAVAPWIKGTSWVAYMASGDGCKAI